MIEANTLRAERVRVRLQDGLQAYLREIGLGALTDTAGKL
jgi:hypothetical protein